jgi:hypothetical protein
MVTPELFQYVKEQLASGFSPNDIRTALTSSGWAVPDIEQVLGGTGVPASPVQAPIPSFEPAATSKSRGVLIAVSALLLVLLIGGGAYAAFVYTNRAPSVAGTSPLPPSSSPAASTITTATFQDTGIQFSYDSTWKKIGGSALVNGKLDDSALAPSATPETQYLFFTPANWTAIKKEMADFQASPPSGNDAFGAAFGLIAKIGYQSDFSLTRMPNTGAQAAARQTTQTTCAGSNIDFSTTNPVVESRVQSTAVGTIKAYVILPESGCDYKTTQVFLDANRTASTPTPAPLPGITITGGSNSSSANDSFILSFGNAADLQHLSQAQQAILNSVKLP